MFHKHYQCLFYGILCPSFVPVSPFLVHWSLHPISLVCILLACMDCCFVYSNNSVCLLWHTFSLHRVQYVDFISTFVYFSPQVNILSSTFGVGYCWLALYSPNSCLLIWFQDWYGWCSPFWELHLFYAFP